MRFLYSVFLCQSSGAIFGLELRGCAFCKWVELPIAGRHVEEQILRALDGDESEAPVLNLLFDGSCNYKQLGE